MAGLQEVTQEEWPSRDAARFYLATMIDGEGSVGLPRYIKSGRCRAARIDIANTDRKLIDRTQSACEYLGIEATALLATRDARWLPCWTLRISKMASIHIVWQEVPICSEKKRERVRDLVDRSYLYRYPSLDSIQDAVDECRGNKTQAARLLGIHRSTVHNRLKTAMA